MTPVSNVQTPLNGALLIKVHYKNSSTTIKALPSMIMEKILSDIAQKKGFDIKTHTLVLCNSNSPVNSPFNYSKFSTSDFPHIELDRTLEYYRATFGCKEVLVVEDQKSYSSICEVEDGKTVLVLQVKIGV
jgi:hypothetical protein